VQFEVRSDAPLNWKEEKNMPQHYHTNPTQLNTPEKIIWGLTARQLLILALGCSLGYKLWANLAFLLTYGVAGFALRLLLAAIPVLFTLALAMIQLGGRYLEIWAILLRYWGRSKHAVWWSVQVKDRYALSLAKPQGAGGETIEAERERE
jgi:hypothetical protein